MNLIAELLTVVAPVFLVAAVGYGWARARQPFESAFTGKLVFNIGAPCLIVSTLLKADLEMEVFGTMALAAVLTHLAAGLVAFAVLKATGQSIRAFLPPCTFGNAGNTGLPLALFAFGEMGLGLAIGYFAAAAMMMYSFGAGISSGVMSFRGLLRIPMLWAVLFVLAMMATDLTLPTFALATLSLIGQLVIPMMLMALGVSLATLTVTSLKRAVLLSLLRLVPGLLIGLAVAELLGLEGAARGVVIIQSSMPPAVFSYLFALRNDNQPTEVAGMIVTCTVMSFAMMPFVILIARG